MRFFAVLFCLAVLLATLPVVASDTQIAHPGQVVQSSQTNAQARGDRDTIGTVLRDLMGSSCATNDVPGCYNDLTLSAGTGLSISVGPSVGSTQGSLYCPNAVSDPYPLPSDGPTSAPSLAPDTNLITIPAFVSTSTTLTVTASSTSGQSQYALIAARCVVEDVTPRAASFENQQTFTVNTVRRDVVVFTVKEGSAATSPSVPPVDTGSVPIGTVLVPYGTTQIASDMLSQYAAYSAVGSSSTTVSAGPNVTVTQSPAGNYIIAAATPSPYPSPLASPPISVSYASGQAKYALGIGNGLSGGSTLSVTNCGSTACTIPLNVLLGADIGPLATSDGFFPIYLGTVGASATLTKFVSDCGTGASGAVVTLYKNGSSVATITLGSSAVTTTTISVSVSSGDTLNVSITTAGTATYCSFEATGTQGLL